MERLDKFLCDWGAGTRSQVKTILKAGRVTVDGKAERDGSRKIDPDTQEVALDGEILHLRGRVVVMLNKPSGFVTATEDKLQKTVMELLPEAYRHLDLKPVGRLDKATEGLLLFTNDGDFAFKMTHPKFRKNKIYEVVLDQPLAPLHQQMISDYGVMLDDGPSQFKVIKDALAAPTDRQHFVVILSEGRNPQIRRPFAALGYQVTKLHRTEFGPFKLNQLPPGQFQTINQTEIVL